MPSRTQMLRALSGLVFVAYHLLFLNFTRLSDPYYRINLFMNPNRVGVCQAMSPTEMSL